MNHKLKTTEFSAHLSRSRMGRYLHHQLSAKEMKEVEIHLIHCERCSEGIMDYVHHEEPHQNKTFQKQLKHKLKTKESTKKIRFTTTQVKIARATVALMLLFVFSFFGIKTVINHQVVVKEEQPKIQVKKSLPAKRPEATLSEEKKTDEVPTKEPSVSSNVNSAALAMESSSGTTTTEKRRKSEPVSEVQNVVKNAPTPVRQDVSTTPSATTKAPSKPEADQQQQTTSRPDAATKAKEDENKPAPLTKVESQATTEDVEESPIVQPLPKIEKLDIQKSENKSEAELEKPAIPTPGGANLLQER